MEEKYKKEYELKKCQSCETEFGCGAGLQTCWCSSVALDEKRAGELRSRFTDCLCSACLAKMTDPCTLRQPS